MNPSCLRQTSFGRIAPLVALFLAATAFAQEPKVRATWQLPKTVWTGQKVTLVVELLAPGYFASAATFDLPDPAGLLVVPSTEHPLVSGETIGDVYYVSQRHELAVYPARAGDLVLPPIHVRFSFKHSPLDHDTVPAEVATAPLKLTVTAPPGTENLGQVISARDLQVEESWRPQPGATGTKVGDAFTRTITFTAPDVPGMIFPPFPNSSIDGLRLYPKAPVLLDTSDRGSLQGGRRDEIIYVCERPGKFTIPAVRLTWWDLKSQQLRTADLPARVIEVAANPALANPVATTPAATRHHFPTGKAAALAAFFLAVLLMVATRRGRRTIAAVLAPFRPVHLAALNPGVELSAPPAGSPQRSN